MNAYVARQLFYEGLPVEWRKTLPDNTANRRLTYRAWIQKRKSLRQSATAGPNSKYCVTADTHATAILHAFKTPEIGESALRDGLKLLNKSGSLQTQVRVHFNRESAEVMKTVWPFIK